MYTTTPIPSSTVIDKLKTHLKYITDLKTDILIKKSTKEQVYLDAKEHQLKKRLTLKHK